MAITVRPADLHRDRDVIIPFLRENLTDQSDAARYDWLYLQNPLGPARAWIAVNDGSESIVGIAGAFPRTMFVNGAGSRGYVLGDFCISPDCRSLGPALSLQRACLNALGQEKALWFDFPSGRMVAIYRRLGVGTGASISRYVKLMRVNEKIRERVPYAGLASGISAVGNLALRLQAWRPSPAVDLEAALHEADFGEEFTVLNRMVADIYPAFGTRSAEYLNWRYRRNPLRRYLTLTARRRGDLVAYAIVSINGREWSVSDILAVDENSSATIIGYVETLGRKQGAERVTAFAMDQSSFGAVIKRAGFSQRESHPVIVSAQDPAGWFLMDGDRES